MLSDKQKRQVYDQYGEEGLKMGGTLAALLLSSPCAPYAISRQLHRCFVFSFCVVYAERTDIIFTHRQLWQAVRPCMSFDVSHILCRSTTASGSRWSWPSRCAARVFLSNIVSGYCLNMSSSFAGPEARLLLQNAEWHQVQSASVHQHSALHVWELVALCRCSDTPMQYASIPAQKFRVCCRVCSRGRQRVPLQ